MRPTADMPRPGILIAVVVLWIILNLAALAGRHFRATQVRKPQGVVTEPKIRHGILSPRFRQPGRIVVRGLTK